MDEFTPEYWQAFTAPGLPGQVFSTSYPAAMPDGRVLALPLRDFGDHAVAGLIANQASFAVLDQLAAWMAERCAGWKAEVVVGLPTLGHAVGAAVARALGHPHWVAPSTTRKLWYDDALSIPLYSVTASPGGANAGRRMWLDPRLLHRLAGRRVLLVDDVISTGRSATAGLDLLRAAGVAPVGLAVTMVQGRRWQAAWPGVPVTSAFETPIFRPAPGGWRPEEGV